MRTHILRIPLLLALLVALAGCSSMGLAPANTFNERLAYAYGVHTAILQATTQLLNAAEMSSDDAEKILRLSDDARALLDTSRALADLGDITTAEHRLALGVTVLRQIQTHLRGEPS